MSTSHYHAIATDILQNSMMHRVLSVSNVCIKYMLIKAMRDLLMSSYLQHEFDKQGNIASICTVWRSSVNYATAANTVNAFVLTGHCMSRPQPNVVAAVQAQTPPRPATTTNIVLNDSYLPRFLDREQIDALDMREAADKFADAEALLLQGLCKSFKPAQQCVVPSRSDCIPVLACLC